MLRRRVSFANIPMCVYFGFVLMGQSEFHRAIPLARIVITHILGTGVF